MLFLNITITMSNFLSAPYEKNTPRTDDNFSLLAKVMEVKQGRYDANKAKIDQTLALYQNNLRGLRDEDNQYIAERVKEAQNIISNYGNRDFSSTTNTETLLSSLRSITEDPIVQSAVMNKAKFDQYNLQVDEVRKKKPESYSDVNYQFGLSQMGYQSYLEGKTKGLSSTNYIDYYDDNKEFKEFSENLEKYDTDIEKTAAPGGDGYLYTQKGKVLTKDDIKFKLDSLLSAKALQQMKINAWASYDQGRTEDEKINNIVTNFNTYKQSKLLNLDQKVAEAELALKNGTASQAYVDQVKLAKTSFEKSANEALADPQRYREAMYTQMYKDIKIDNFASAFAYNTVSTTISPDTTFVAMKKLEWDRYMDEENLKVAQFKAGMLGGAGQASDIQQKADPNFEPESEKGDLVTAQTERINSYDGLIKQASTDIMSSLDEETKNLINKKVEASGGKKTVEDVLIELGETSKKIVSAKGFKELSTYRLEQAIERDILLKYEKQARAEQDATLDSEDFVKELYNNSDIRILWRSGIDGKEKMFAPKAILEANGIVSKEGKVLKKLSDVPAVMNSIRKAMFADQAIATGTPYEKWDNIKNLAISLGEDPTKVIKKRVMTDSQGNKIQTDYDYLDPNSKTWKYYNYAEKSGSYNNFTKLDNYQRYKKGVNPEQIKKRVGELLAKDETISIGKLNMVSPKTNSFARLKGLMGNKIDDNTSIAISVIPGQPNMVRATQERRDSKGALIEPIVQDLRIEDLPQEVTSQVDFTKKKGVITVKTVPETPYDVIYDTPTTSNLKDIAETHFGGNVQLAKQTTEDGAKEYLFGVRRDITGTEESPTETGRLVLEALKDSELKVGLTKGTSNDAYITIYKGKNLIWKDETWRTDSNIKETFDLVRYTPQIIVNNWIANMLAKGSTLKLKELYGGK